VGTNNQVNLNSLSGIIVGVILSIIGIIVVIAGVIVLIVDRRRIGQKYKPPT
jgi:beta-lactamase regulating signal transducer with metallopeptidase domain